MTGTLIPSCVKLRWMEQGEFCIFSPYFTTQGERVRLRLIGIGQFIHPMHLHGMAFQIVVIDGHPVPEAAQLAKDTISVAPGER